MESSKIKVGVTSAAIALTCAGITYVVLRYKYRLRDAAEALNYLTVKTVTTEKVCDEVINVIRRRTKIHKAVGFDCEWVTERGRRHPVALVQLSTFDGFCGLFRLNLMATVPNSLKSLLEDETIYKVGVAATDDAKYLYQDYSVTLKSTIDIRHLAELCSYNPGGLAALSKSLLRVVLDKSWRIRCSNWEADELTHRQINYAAADAHVAIKIFVCLVNQYSKSTILSLLNNNNIWNNLDKLCANYVDVNFKTKQTVKQKGDVTKERKEGKVKDVRSKRYPHATRSKPLYHNCYLEAPDGEMLCTCDNKKAMWYVEKELADVVGKEPLTVRLRFEPAGRSVGDVGRYYQLTKENKCVVCGKTESYIRKNVVPREYRKYFPEIMKDHSSHDVVLLCADCHQTSNMRDQVVRERLAALCNAPLSLKADQAKYIEDMDCKKIRSAARALLYQTRKHVLPDARREELENIILQHYPQNDEVTEELLVEAAKIQVVFENADYESHGLKVVEYYFNKEGGLLRLEELWREHFLTSMKPKYMPDLWSVKHNEERLRVKWNEGRLSEKDVKLIGLLKWL
ncbi:exonuclease 3'-5' domain-containing protein 2 isoform X2 [Hyposmocoma kahamanoa]|uniref:exonuclease 3'-5' domain-containing protein 2 isoform X2 n=1 Tax=Hyposmocoma kahamanoa TaxID=1477025 RepID=UPI000E6D7066|nr:exonuclease 3'-5' domain-containing protein 2 isoform X2 [Hyposmocoma kahamanoa]